MKSKLLYFILVFLTAYLGIMYEGFKAVELLRFEILLFIGMFFLALYLKQGITVHLEGKLPVAEKGQAVPIKICVKNKHKQPVTRILIKLMFENDGGYNKGEIPIWCSLDGCEEKTIHYDVSTDYCGIVRLSISKVKVYDYLKLWSFSIKCTEEIQGYILPNIHEIITTVSEKTRGFLDLGEEYDPNQSGDDPSEVFQIRDFRAGDTLQRVHWKMSAKADELITKEFSRSVGSGVLLLLDLYSAGDSFGLIEKDAFLEIAASISYSLMDVGCRHYIGWLEEKTEEIERQYVQDETQVYEMIYRVLHLRPYLKKCDLLFAYRATYNRAYFNTVLILNTDFHLIRNDEVIVDFSEDKHTNILDGLLLEV